MMTKITAVLVAAIVCALMQSTSQAGVAQAPCDTAEVKAGTTSKIIEVFISDSSSGTGAGLAGLAYNTAGLSVYYHRSGSSTASTSVTLATMTLGTWVSGGFVAIDGTNMPGWYAFGIPDAALASGAKAVDLHFKGATNMVPLPITIKLAI